MADRTTQSWTTVPHFFVSREIDCSALKVARDAMVPKIEELHGVKMTHTDLIIAAVARALRKHPRMSLRQIFVALVRHRRAQQQEAKR